MSDKILGRDEILAADDHELIDVEVPEWGGTVLVKPLTGDERDQYESSNWRRDPKGGMQLDTRGARARLAQMCLVDESGKRLFSKEDVRKLGAKSSHALDRVTEVARTASGISDDYVEDAVEDFDEDEAAGVASSYV